MLNLQPPNTNPSNGRNEEDLNPESPDYKSSALTIRPRHLHKMFNNYSPKWRKIFTELLNIPLNN